MHILHTILCTSQGADEENLFNNQEFHELVINSFIHMTLMFDSEEIL